MLEIVEQSLYVIALIGEILLIVIGVNAIRSKKDKLAGSFLILAGVVGLSVLTGRTAFGFMVGFTVLALCLLGWYVTGIIKSTSQEKRRYPRAKITWPVVVMTPNGPVDGVTQNLSAGGAFILCSELPELDHHFHLVIKPFERPPLLVSAEKVWSDNSTSEARMSHGTGLSFKVIVDGKDQQFIRDAASGRV